MPHIDINMFAGRDDETKKRVADALVETMMKELGCAKEHLSVAIYDQAPDQWDSFADTVDETKLYAGKVYRSK